MEALTTAPAVPARIPVARPAASSPAAAAIEGATPECSYPRSVPRGGRKDWGYRTSRRVSRLGFWYTSAGTWTVESRRNRRVAVRHEVGRQEAGARRASELREPCKVAGELQTLLELE